MNATNPNITHPIPRRLTAQELAQAGGGASDFLLELDGVKGESSAKGGARPVIPPNSIPFQLSLQR